MGKKIATIITFLFFNLYGFTQKLDSLQKKYPFLKTAENKIDNPENLKFFLENIKSLSQAQIKTVSILHIGDSHLQADYLPNGIRTRLQAKFGNAGRGLVFPQKVAKTNESYCYKSSSTGNWRGRRIVINKDTMAVGIGGISLYTKDVNAQINFELRQLDSINDNFSRIEIIYRKSKLGLIPVLLDSSNKTTALKCLNRENDLYDEFCFEKSTSKFKMGLEAAPINSGDSGSFLFHGFNLLKDENGILFHSVGVNGAEYRHYNSQMNFFEESKILNPQLIIISLGTNEAYAKNFNPTDFIASVDTCIKRLKLIHPNCSFLLTGPGDANKRVKYKNHHNQKASKALEKYCLENNLAFYNLFKVMGGYGIINKWFAKGLTSKDRLHLNKNGYDLQALLIYEALMNEIKNYGIN